MKTKIKKAVVNNDGFTLIEILIALVVIGVLAAISINGYIHMQSTAATGGIVNNIQKFETISEQYATMNSGSFSSISAGVLLSDGLLPKGWTATSAEAEPPNTATVSAYYITTGALGLNESSYDIGFTGNGNGITDNMVHTICLDFENKIDGFMYNGAVTQITTGGTNCNAIPLDNTAITGTFYLGFE